MRLHDGFCVSLFVGLLPALLSGQTDAYMVEVLEEREVVRAVEEQTFTASQPDFSFRGPATMRDESRIGSARGATRGGRGGSTMLRYDQHRALTPPADATLRIGPWYTDIGIALRAGYRYTRFRGRSVDFLDGIRRGEIEEGGSEFPVSATLTMNNYMLLTRRLDLSLNLRMSYFHYPLGTQEDQFVIDLTDEGLFATFSTQFHPTRDSRILVYDDILYLTDFVDRRGISDRLGGREYKLLQNVVGTDWDWRAGPRDAFSASASRTDTLPQSREFRDQRRVQYAEMASYRRQFTSFAAGGALLQGSQSLAQTEARPDSFVHGYSLFTGLNLTQTLDFNASLGQQFAVVRGGDLAEERSSQTVTAAVSLNHDLGQGRSQQLHARRSVVESFEGGIDVTDTLGYRYGWSGLWLPGSFTSDYTIVDPLDPRQNGYRNWDNRLQVRTQLTQIVPLHLSAGYAMRFNEVPAGPTVGMTIDDAETRSDYQTLSLVARTGFRITARINFTAYAQHVQRMADDARLAYTRETFGAQLTWSHKF
ncbi:MAG: hypothetical protein ACNA71_00680 [Kiritimatiellia bacterium]